MRLFIFLFSIIHTLFFTQLVNVDELRKEYYKINTDSASCARLYQKAVKDNSTDNTIIGYKGAITAAMANYGKNKQEKLNLFNSGKKLIEQAIINDKNNVELHFLRLTIQSNCPKVLAYNKEIENDKNYIIANWESVNNIILKNRMSDFLLQSKYVTAAEKQKIKSLNKE